MLKRLFLCLILSVFTATSFAAEEKEGLSIDELETRLQKLDSNINDTKEQIREVKDASYLSDLYFVLAEFLVDKSRVLYQLKIAENPEVPVEELDFTLEKRPKQEAIGVYDNFLAKFPNESRRDKALFFKAHELRELGRSEDMLGVYREITKDFPKSQYWAEAQLALGDIYFTQKKDYELALEYFNQIVAREPSAFTSVAYYKIGWCYINSSDFLKAYKAYDSAIRSAEAWLKEGNALESDIRKEALQAMVWPYSELKDKEVPEVHPLGTSTLNHFRSISFGFDSYLGLLKRLSRRMKIKKKFRDSVDASMEFVKLSNETPDRMDQIRNIYQILRKSIKDVKWKGFAETLGDFMADLELDDSVSAKELRKIQRDIELVLRDIAIQMQKASNTDSGWAEEAILAYTVYIDYFPKHKYTKRMKFNRANLMFSQGRGFDAGKDYESLAMGSVRSLKSSKQSLIKAALESYLSALQAPDLRIHQRLQARNAVRGIGAYFLRKYPKNEASSTILFNIGQSYYNERDFAKSRVYFRRFLQRYPGDPQASLAANQILDGHNQKEEYNKLISDGKWILSQRKLANPSLRESVKEIVSQARLLLAKKESGDFTKDDYAENMMKIASKYKGTDLGDKALYEAFILFRSQRSEQMYEPGEKLLSAHSKSRYAKQAAANMVSSALVTADFARAARYLEYYGKNFPRDKESAVYLKQAAEIRKLIKDYRSAKRIYGILGDNFSVAEMDFESKNWQSLSKSALKVGEPFKSFWTASALNGMRKPALAKQLLGRNLSVVRSSGEKAILAESIYLMANISLEQYKELRFSKKKDPQLVIAAKTKSLAELSKQFTEVIGTGDPEYTLAALSGLGETNKNFAVFLKTAAPPKGLSAAQKKLFKEALSKQAAQYLASADKFFKQCMETASKFQVYSKFLKYCQKKTSEVKLPSKLPEFHDSKDEEIISFRKALFDKPRDQEVYSLLISKQIINRHFGNALASIRRAQELFPEKATFYLYDVIVQLHLGDFFEAGQKLKQANSLGAYSKRGKLLKALMDQYFGYKKNTPRIDADSEDLLPGWLLQ